jgi:hypothetical protein
MYFVLLRFTLAISARKPRTECCCQPVAFISPSIVVPRGERSIAIAADCFVPTRVVLCADPFVRLRAFGAFSG